MKAETLISLTAPASARLDGRGATAQELLDRATWFRRGTGKDNGKVRWAPAAKSSSTPQNAQWSFAEMAMACKGLAAAPFAVLLFDDARNDDVYYEVKQHLYVWAQREAVIRNWPATIVTDEGSTPYLERLCALVLTERRFPWRFCEDLKGPKPAMRRVLLGCSNDVWRRRVAPIYNTLQGQYELWLGIGLTHMQKRLQE